MLCDPSSHSILLQPGHPLIRGNARRCRIPVICLAVCTAGATSRLPPTGHCFPSHSTHLLHRAGPRPWAAPSPPPGPASLPSPRSTSAPIGSCPLSPPAGPHSAPSPCSTSRGTPACVGPSRLPGPPSPPSSRQGPTWDSLALLHPLRLRPHSRHHHLHHHLMTSMPCLLSRLSSATQQPCPPGRLGPTHVHQSGRESHALSMASSRGWTSPACRASEQSMEWASAQELRLMQSLGSSRSLQPWAK